MMGNDGIDIVKSALKQWIGTGEQNYKLRREAAICADPDFLNDESDEKDSNDNNQKGTIYCILL